MTVFRMSVTQLLTFSKRHYLKFNDYEFEIYGKYPIFAQNYRDMKNRLFILFFLLLAFSSCSDEWIKKPKPLIPEKQMIDILVDVHLSNAMYSLRQYPDKKDVRLKPADFYYSVLHKYNISDTIFEESLIYYSCYPKKFEKMYSKVLDKISQIDQEYSEKEDRPIDIGNNKDQ
ncbi:hypothetical protein MNBD_BACTEROID01-2472 [hydrothermal vent metagenome]|uniref:DUF4296 domain-containing protein n=1 Tax=hydrothermal vent metagenome TaxID=652676 RepID=A0A3B0TLX9_9ZZZZ